MVFKKGKPIIMSPYSELQKRGTIEALEEVSNPNRPNIVIFHGYGADAYNLAPLQEVLDPHQKFNWFFPNGPIPLDLGLGMRGHAWVHLDLEAFQRQLRSTPPPQDLSKVVPTVDREEMRSEIEAWWIAVSTAHGLVKENTLFGGFSQGAMTAIDLALFSNLSTKGLLLMSAALLDQADWDEGLQKAQRLPYFQTHGQQDDVLPFYLAESLHKLFQKNQWEGEFRSFSGGHEIPPHLFGGIIDFIQKTLK
jgi:phospholipase/carboxylesterase